MKNLDKKCPCTSGNLYAECCQPLHTGIKPKNALELMRSRFAAFALHLSEYIIHTTHPASPQYSENHFGWKKSLTAFTRETTFKKLEILDFKEREHIATVTFVAHLTQKGQNVTFTEKSIFERFEKRWMYQTGLVRKGRDLKLIQKTPLKLLPLAYYENPILRKKGEPVIAITDEIKHLIEAMIETLDTCEGWGLAAPQVYHSLQLFILREPIEQEDGHFRVGDVKVFINPKILNKRDETWKAPEGCLSIPTISGEVERSKTIEVEFTDLNGKKQIQTFSGWEAKVIQHETDHINGILFIDRLTKKEKMQLTHSLKRLEKRLSQAT